ncbi:hypothetical protein ACFXJ8_08660 [Nonomuraea sp. NPDC059194]|uniref:hypothetical protein n=1 Tax=Nonomuraea sp. NPDC059194 TaxID=3346764 RepID=UPI0036A6B8A9
MLVIYLVYRMRLSGRAARRNMKEFWTWLEDRERWFYQELPMVREVRWYYSDRRAPARVTGRPNRRSPR